MWYRARMRYNIDRLTWPQVKDVLANNQDLIKRRALPADDLLVGYSASDRELCDRAVIVDGVSYPKGDGWICRKEIDDA